MATSARLNMPVRRGPSPSRTKSMATPWLNRRSSKFPIPPAAIKDNPTNDITLRPCVLKANIRVRVRTALTKMMKNTRRISLGKLAPRPSIAPGFSLYSIRTESFRSEMGGDEANDSFAMYFVAWSQLVHETNIKMTKPSRQVLFTFVSPGFSAARKRGQAAARSARSLCSARLPPSATLSCQFVVTSYFLLPLQ